MTAREELIAKLSDEMDPSNARDLADRAIDEALMHFVRNLRTIQERWEEIASRPSRPTGFAICAHDLGDCIAARVGARR